jgi:hypothetical protein
VLMVCDVRVIVEEGDVIRCRHYDNHVVVKVT